MVYWELSLFERCMKEIAWRYPPAGLSQACAPVDNGPAAILPGAGKKAEKKRVWQLRGFVRLSPHGATLRQRTRRSGGKQSCGTAARMARSRRATGADGSPGTIANVQAENSLSQGIPEGISAKVGTAKSKNPMITGTCSIRRAPREGLSQGTVGIAARRPSDAGTAGRQLESRPAPIQKTVCRERFSQQMLLK